MPRSPPPTNPSTNAHYPTPCRSPAATPSHPSTPPSTNTYGCPCIRHTALATRSAEAATATAEPSTTPDTTANNHPEANPRITPIDRNRCGNGRGRAQRPTQLHTTTPDLLLARTSRRCRQHTPRPTLSRAPPDINCVRPRPPIRLLPWLYPPTPPRQQPAASRQPPAASSQQPATRQRDTDFIRPRSVFDCLLDCVKPLDRWGALRKVRLAARSLCRPRSQPDDAHLPAARGPANSPYSPPSHRPPKNATRRCTRRAQSCEGPRTRPQYSGAPPPVPGAQGLPSPS